MKPIGIGIYFHFVNIVYVLLLFFFFCFAFGKTFRLTNRQIIWLNEMFRGTHFRFGVPNFIARLINQMAVWPTSFVNQDAISFRMVNPFLLKAVAENIRKL